ncbi:conserved hypothetical protein [Leishmania braziliensis MHOM/BR/75/M2904]|uniref:Uncharacterized protein n=3 Tax=Viannia TaxID=37616 RepID=A4HIY8_LEIBR|nr:conserved hypothetical protein [Leishmania braziliensis MHOM/BR/75/M2904]KAI5685035.1 hypothetical protein MNV84_05652 [Leishmania braziliensis]CAJ2476644.1 unnamed protein product [Leishmania braziliensis]CAJ2477086.1 unnamed protein product [Leishmania braziliensis]CAM42444.1 conserved hypothetical protein [Leishmania braziliensis MHOM/BR/75/M2904]
MCVIAMEYVDTYGGSGGGGRLRSGAQESTTATGATRPYLEQRTAAPVTSALGQELDRLVGGTLAAQEYRDRLEALTRSVQASDEKVLNLTRLVKLSQSIQEEKETDLQRQNDELRARLKRQEQLTTQLQRQLEDMQAAVDVQAFHQVVARLEGQVSAYKGRQEEEWVSLQQRIGELEERLQRTSTCTAERCEQRLMQLDERLQQITHSTADATNQWAKRNFIRLKEHVDSLRVDLDDVRGGQQELKSTVQSASCRAEVEYKKVLLLLQQKTKEADALSSLVEKELQHLQKVAHRHQILASKDITPAFEFDEKPYDALKFAGEGKRRGAVSAADRRRR